MIAITTHALSGWHHGHAPVFNHAIMRWPDIASPFTMPEPHKNGTMNTQLCALLHCPKNGIPKDSQTTNNVTSLLWTPRT